MEVTQVRHRPCWFIFAGLLAAMLVGIAGCGKQPRRVTLTSPTKLVILVSGTFASDAIWNRQDVPQLTLAKVLAAGCDREDRVLAFHWSGGVSHSDRTAAANSLVQFIAQQRRSGDEVVLVGHSHGGNVCLLAAAQSRDAIDTVVCLGTPHIYWQHTTSDRRPHFLPVYCSPRTLEKTRSVIAVSDPDDRVAEEWSNLLITGVSDGEARRATTDWQRIAGESKRQSRPALQRLFESGNVFATRELSVANVNLQVGTDDPRLLGITPHQQMRDPEMGKVINQLIRP